MPQSNNPIRIEVQTAAGRIFLTEIDLLNIGGEGEVAGAVNLNSLEATIRREDDIRAAGPLIVADMRETKLPDDCIARVIGNMVPLGPIEWRLQVASEQLRILQSGGSIKLSSWSGPDVWVATLRDAGFEGVRIEQGYATGFKP